MNKYNRTESHIYVTWSRLKLFWDVRTRGPSSPGLVGIAKRVSVRVPLRIYSRRIKNEQSRLGEYEPSSSNDYPYDHGQGFSSRESKPISTG